MSNIVKLPDYDFLRGRKEVEDKKKRHLLLKHQEGVDKCY
jgi:hypothetical protein